MDTTYGLGFLRGDLLFEEVLLGCHRANGKNKIKIKKVWLFILRAQERRVAMLGLAYVFGRSRTCLTACCRSGLRDAQETVGW